MSDDTKLIILKSDLQLVTSVHDEYLKQLLNMGAAAIKREGIILGDDIESDMVVIQYAAYLWRKRSAPDTQMPRYLRYQLNNMLFSQKGVT